MNPGAISEIIAGFLILTGTLASLLSSFGLIRLPDVYTRSHAASKSSTLGVLFTLVGTFVFFLFNEGYFSVRLFLGILFVFLTAPVSAHLIARASYMTKVKMAQSIGDDGFREVLMVEEKAREQSSP
ncbi:Na+/H+ antiporter subunit G [Neobacillus piezotolerans]|uniref:Na+/H+ antiporter subunit G n=1 Tax=Neobacillus piezotolerans TaxID=2259171 RepID=A0A3D8GWB2_9BACI|nr:monovalent cation/H(+) antiporter subunit G [Neobacillus piezotolerans]RDU38725.1 Na+/H+ antiporter subunit G [Neobacillus piezotolerans]